MIHPHLIPRQPGYNMLHGTGLEIGAMHQPADIPGRCKISYCDAHTKEESIALFPEINPNDCVNVDHICDLDKRGLDIFPDKTFDFVIMNHVIEHVANPIHIISELFRIVKRQGLVVISAPDKNYIFDRDRELTTWQHLLEDYMDNTQIVSDEHYLEFIYSVHPEIVTQGIEAIHCKLQQVRKRREHPHVWDAPGFSEFIQKCFTLLDITAECRFLSMSDKNHLEYFAVWKKG